MMTRTLCGSLPPARKTHYLMVARGPLAFPALPCHDDHNDSCNVTFRIRSFKGIPKATPNDLAQNETDIRSGERPCKILSITDIHKQSINCPFQSFDIEVFPAENLVTISNITRFLDSTKRQNRCEAFCPCLTSNSLTCPHLKAMLLIFCDHACCKH